MKFGGLRKAFAVWSQVVHRWGVGVSIKRILPAKPDSRKLAWVTRSRPNLRCSLQIRNNGRSEATEGVRKHSIVAGHDFKAEEAPVSVIQAAGCLTRGAFGGIRMRSEAFAERHSLAFGVGEAFAKHSRSVREAFARRSRGDREAFARRSRGVREAFARRSRGVRSGRAFGACVRGVCSGRAFGSVQRRSTTVGLSAISDGLGWPWDDPLGRYGCAAFLFKTTRTQQYAIEGDRKRSYAISSLNS